MKFYTRRSFLKLCALALSVLSFWSKLLIFRLRGRKAFFVDSTKGRDYYPGTAKAPFQTIERAWGKGGNTIYLLPGEHTFPEPIPEGTTLIGIKDGSLRPKFK